MQQLQATRSLRHSVFDPSFAHPVLRLGIDPARKTSHRKRNRGQNRGNPFMQQLRKREVGSRRKQLRPLFSITSALEQLNGHSMSPESDTKRYAADAGVLPEGIAGVQGYLWKVFEVREF
jgi:hypothetical protein